MPWLIELALEIRAEALRELADATRTWSANPRRSSRRIELAGAALRIAREALGELEPAAPAIMRDERPS